MFNSKNTKRSLLMSALALVLCVSMLVGSTFAWFTDTASTGVNAIQSGTLDIQLLMKQGDEWVSAEGKTLNFISANGNQNILWEPGCTYELPALKVVNNGNLHVKYQITITGIEGDAKLLEVIDFTIEGEDALTGTLAPNAETPEITLIGSMAKDANNDYMGLTMEAISITVMATQMTAEYDSNDNLYDENAAYPRPGYVPIIAPEDLENALANAEQGKPAKFYLTDDVILDAPLEIKDDMDVELDLAGKTLTVSNSTAIAASEGNLVIKNGIIKNVGQPGTATADTTETQRVSIRLSGNATASITDVEIETVGIGLLVEDNATVTELNAKIKSVFHRNGSYVYDAIQLTGNGRIEQITGGEYTTARTEEYIQWWFEQNPKQLEETISYTVNLIDAGASIGEIKGGTFIGEMDKANNGTPIHVNAGTVEKISGGYFGFAKYTLSSPWRLLYVNAANGASIGQITGGTFEKGTGGYNCDFANIVEASGCQVVDTGDTVEVDAQFSTKITTYTLNVVKVVAQ